MTSMLQVVEALAVAALRLQFKTSENLACVLLLASRAVAATVPLVGLRVVIRPE